MSGTLFAQTFFFDNIQYSVSSPTTVGVAYNNFYSGVSINIPNTVTYNNTNYTVTAISNAAFYDAWLVTSVTIPDTVTYIGNAAFIYCSSLTSVTINNNIPLAIISNTFAATPLQNIYVPPCSVTAYQNAPIWQNYNVNVIPGSIIPPTITPTFDPIAPICSGATLSPLPTTSLEGVTGTWSPALNNTATTTYTFTPTVGQCATSTTMTINVNTTPPPIVGTSLISDIIVQNSGNCVGFGLSTYTGVLNGKYSYESASLVHYTISFDGVKWSLKDTVGAILFENSTISPDLSPPTSGWVANISQVCSYNTLSVTIENSQTVGNLQTVCSGATIASLTATGTTLKWYDVVENGTPLANATMLVSQNYYVSQTVNGCESSRQRVGIIVNPFTTPTFNSIPPVCIGTTLSPLPITSLEGVTGTWSPVVNNTATTTYTFTPDAGQCATTTTMAIFVNPVVTPTFNVIAPICRTDRGVVIASPLQLTSTNNITGTWSPAFSSSTATTTTYTFTPNAGQCATTTTLQIVVNQNVNPSFLTQNNICAGLGYSPLPTSSINSITGTWSPAFNNMVTTTYTFTPTAGQCATTATITIVVNPNIIPTFDSISPICSGITLPPLPTTSTNGITGSWSPALNNTVTTTYTFTPVAGQCASSSNITITVNSAATWYADADNDGFGNPSSSLSACTQPVGYVSNNTDCDDTQILYQDLDNDGLGSYIEVACGVDNTNDCDDTNALVNYYPFHLDLDGDGYGQTTLTLVCASNATTPPAGYSLIAGDCNDNNPLSHSEFIFWQDNDGDGYGGIYQIYLCANGANTPPLGFSANSLDCNDSNVAIHPGATEICNDGIDNDCDGVVDNGCIQRTTVIRPTLCGTTLPTISTLLWAVQYPGATGYQFEVTNTTTGIQLLPPYQSNNNYFNITQMPGYDYSTTYSIRVMIKYNGVWLGYYGLPCLVTTPSLTQNGLPQITPALCGTTLTSLSSLIGTPGLAGVKCYRFKVTNTVTGAVQFIDRCAVPPATTGIPWFSLTMLTNYNYGTTYQIEVAVSSNGVSYSAYGLPCNVNTPRVPALTNYCGLLVPTKSTLINTANLAFVTVYRFEVTNLTTNSVKNIDKGIAPLPLQSYFNLNNLVTAPSIYAANTNYSVRVALMTGGTYSPFGQSCIITSPNIARLSEAQEPIISNVFDVTVSPNPFEHHFGMLLNSTSMEDVAIKVYDMIGRLVEQRTVKGSDVMLQEIGDRFPSGVYNVIVTQGLEVKTIRVIKR